MVALFGSATAVSLFFKLSQSCWPRWGSIRESEGRGGARLATLLTPGEFVISLLLPLLLEPSQGSQKHNRFLESLRLIGLSVKEPMLLIGV